jgi:hypothetical protein
MNPLPNCKTRKTNQNKQVRKEEEEERRKNEMKNNQNSCSVFFFFFFFSSFSLSFSRLSTTQSLTRRFRNSSTRFTHSPLLSSLLPLYFFWF